MIKVYEDKRSSSISECKKKNKFVYEIRYTELDWSKPETIEKSVCFNFYGTLISDKELEFNGQDFIPFDKIDTIFPFAERPKHLAPKFKVGEHVTVIDVGTIYITHFRYPGSNIAHEREWHDSTNKVWTYLDECRINKIGKKGKVKSIEFHDMIAKPRVSRFGYRVEFRDKARSLITFCEENLVKW